MLTLVMRMVAIDSGGLGIAHAEHSPIGIHYHRSGVGLGWKIDKKVLAATALLWLRAASCWADLFVLFVVPCTEVGPVFYAFDKRLVT